MALLGLASAIAGFVKVRFLEDKEVIDNLIFRMHSRVTCAILFLACALCTATTLIGDPIACIGDNKDGKLEKPLNTYCWISSTFTLPHNHDKPTEHVAYPGLGSYEPGVHKQKFHSYYQWVPFTLLFQGILFYLPHWIWKTLEQKKIHIITRDLRGIKMDSKCIGESCENLASYLMETMHCNIIYGFGYMMCELLNLINVVGNIFLIDKFLGNVFMNFGLEVISFSNMDQFNRTDPMIKIFPRITKCTFHSFGFTGTIQTFDLMCVMAINVINEKIYIFLWFWLFILCGLTILGIAHSLILVFSRKYRGVVLRGRFMSRPEAEFLANKLPFGDFMLLHFLSLNMNSSIFDTVMKHMAIRLNFKGYQHPPCN